MLGWGELEIPATQSSVIGSFYGTNLFFKWLHHKNTFSAIRFELDFHDLKDIRTIQCRTKTLLTYEPKYTPISRHHRGLCQGQGELASLPSLAESSCRPWNLTLTAQWVRIKASPILHPRRPARCGPCNGKWGIRVGLLMPKAARRLFELKTVVAMLAAVAR